MTKNELIQYIKLGREIEFSYNNRSLFLAPQYDQNHCFLQYYIYDNVSKKIIVAGTIEDILDFEFASHVSLRNNTDLFNFDYIL